MSSSETFDTEIVDISEFFSSKESSSGREDESENKSTFNAVDSPIKELKAIILSLDWEITDEIADNFISEVDRLQDVWKADKSVISFLQILRALGKYLRTHKADAHPESIKLLYSVYNNFEKIVLTNEITEDQEKFILKEELEKFHQLKEKIALAATAASEGKANESLLSALKTILLEIDWKITDQTMQKFDLEINKLEQIWSSDKNFLTPLQMMRAIGKYINKNKLDSHPDSIKLLSTVFNHFEKMALSEEMSPEEQQELIQDDLEKFSQLKANILSVKEAPSPEHIIETESYGPAAIKTKIDLPAKAHEYGDSFADEDLGYVEPISFDTDENVQPPAFASGFSDAPGSAEEEVGNRLDALFADDKDLDEGELKPLEPSSDSKEVDGRLDYLFAENDQGLPSGPAATLSGGMDGVVPLASAEEDVDLDLRSDSLTPSIPPGQISSDLTYDQEIETVTPMPVEPLPVEPLPEGLLQDSTNVPGWGEAKRDSGIFPDVEVPERTGEEKKLQVNRIAPLLEIIGSAKDLAQLDISTLTREISTLEESLQNPSQQILLQIVQSISIYIERVRIHSHPESLKIMMAAGQKLAEIETSEQEQPSDFFNTIQPILSQYIEFQNSILFPAVSAFTAREEEIKKILGLTL